MSAGIDLLAILPFIGLLKYLDDTSTGFKSMKKAFVNSKDGIEDSIRHLLQNVPDNLKKITSIQVFTKHFAPLRKGVKETLEETGQKSDDLLENIQAIDKKVDIKDVAEEVGEGGKYSAFGEMSEVDGVKYSQWTELRKAGLDQQKVNDIILTNKGYRPDPSTYLSQEYIETHLAQFDDGAAYLLPKKSYDLYYRGTPEIAREDGTLFVTSKEYLNEVLEKANGDLSYVEEALGYPKGSLSGGEFEIININNPTKYNINMPSGNEAGANSEWIPGGYTSGDVPEAVVNHVPNNPDAISIDSIKLERK